MIIIKTKRVYQKVQGYEIIKATALPLSRLPVEYVKHTPYCFGGQWKGQEGICICTEKRDYLILPGKWYSREEWSKILAILAKAGKRLGKINAAWSGYKTFKI